MSKYGPQNSWLFCSLNNIPDVVMCLSRPANHMIRERSGHQAIVIFLFVFVSVASCRSQSIVQQECQCTVRFWSMQFACALHYTAVRLATTCFFLEVLL